MAGWRINHFIDVIYYQHIMKDTVHFIDVIYNQHFVDVIYEGCPIAMFDYWKVS